MDVATLRKFLDFYEGGFPMKDFIAQLVASKCLADITSLLYRPQEELLVVTWQSGTACHICKEGSRYREEIHDGAQPIVQTYPTVEDLIEEWELS